MATGDAYLARRLQPFTTTIFATMSELAAETGAVNLGQGFPDTDGPDELREIAVVGDNGQIVGFLDEAEITRVYHDATVSRRPE